MLWGGVREVGEYYSFPYLEIIFLFRYVTQLLRSLIYFAVSVVWISQRLAEIRLSIVFFQFKLLDKTYVSIHSTTVVSTLNVSCDFLSCFCTIAMNLFFLGLFPAWIRVYGQGTQLTTSIQRQW